MYNGKYSYIENANVHFDKHNMKFVIILAYLYDRISQNFRFYSSLDPFLATQLHQFVGY